MKELLLSAWDEVSRSDIIFKLLDVGVVLLKIIFTVVVIYLIKRIIERLIKDYFEKTSQFHIKLTRKNTLKRLSLNVLQYVYYFVLIYTILSLLGIPVGTLVAGAGIVGLAISFGAKDLIADFVNGFFILLESQYDVGDEVLFNNDLEGEVIDLGIRTTTVRSYNGTTNYIANGEIKLVSNFSQHEYRIPYQFLVYPDTDTDRLSQVLDDSFEASKEKDPRVSRLQNLGVMRDGQGRLVYEVRMWVHDHADEININGEYYKMFLQAIQEAGIELPAGSITSIGYKE